MKVTKLNEDNNQELYGLYYDYFGNEKHPLVFSGYRKWDDSFFDNEVLPSSVNRNRVYFKTNEEAQKYIDTQKKAWKDLARVWKIVKVKPHTKLDLVKVKVDMGDYHNSDIWDKIKDKVMNKEISNEEFWGMEKHNYATAYADKRYYDTKVNK